MRVRIARVALLACAAAAPVYAQAPAAPIQQQGRAAFDAATLDPSVSLVFSGGRWVSGGQRGIFRVVVLRDGPDPRRSRVIVQWLDQHRQTGRTTIHASREVDVIPPGVWALDAPRLDLRSGQWLAILTGTTDAGRIRRTWRFDLSVPGKLREVAR